MDYVLPYNSASESAKMLADGLGVRRIRTQNSKLPKYIAATVVNWGNSTFDWQSYPNLNFINHPESVGIASNKLKFFEAIQEYNEDACQINIPEWTTVQSTAQLWLDEGHDVVVRHKLQGHSADGIELLRANEDNLVPLAPLYTKYFKKKDEYRVHVMNGVPFDIQRKAARFTGKPANYQIRNHANGFVYKRQDINPPQEVISVALEAVFAIGLHFGAVDVCWNQSLQKAVVFEVNTACGLEGKTYRRYLNVLKERDYLDLIPKWNEWNDE